jgi:hypothetical protein
MNYQPRLQYYLRVLLITTAVAAGSFSVATTLFRSRAPDWFIALVAMLLFVTSSFILYIRTISMDMPHARKVLDEFEAVAENPAKFGHVRHEHEER